MGGGCGGGGQKPCLDCANKEKFQARLKLVENERSKLGGFKLAQLVPSSLRRAPS